jgi:16S rRNA (cytidine1402-2'-O)-methyltransferase
VKTGNLYLVPTTIADGTHTLVIPPIVIETLKSVRHFLVEDIRSARRHLSSLKIYDTIESLDFNLLNKDTSSVEIEGLLRPALEGNHLGVISESGSPGIADPGALAVSAAHHMGIRVIPLPGPSSILLALMSSGLNGQQFAFHGYLPVDKTDAIRVVRELEVESRRKDQTQIFIETPYRNNHLFTNLMKALSGTTRLCVAVDLTGNLESIMTRTISEWKSIRPDWPKLPAVFLFLAR